MEARQPAATLPAGLAIPLLQHRLELGTHTAKPSIGMGSMPASRRVSRTKPVAQIAVVEWHVGNRGGARPGAKTVTQKFRKWHSGRED